VKFSYDSDKKREIGIISPNDKISRIQLENLKHFKTALRKLNHDRNGVEDGKNGVEFIYHSDIPVKRHMEIDICYNCGNDIDKPEDACLILIRKVLSIHSFSSKSISLHSSCISEYISRINSLASKENDILTTLL
jgi:hypothetical protein